MELVAERDAEILNGSGFGECGCVLGADQEIVSALLPNDAGPAQDETGTGLLFVLRPPESNPAAGFNGVSTLPATSPPETSVPPE